MFEAVREKRKWFDFEVSDEESCLKAIRNGGIAAFFSAAMTAIIAIIAMNTTPSDDPTVAYILDPWIMVDAVLLAILGLFVFRKSRAAATILLVYFTLSKIMMWIDLGAPKGLFVSALFFMIYLTAARATFSWHSTYEQASHHTEISRRPAKPRFGLIVSFYTIFFALLVVMSVVSIPELWIVLRAEGGALSLVEVALAVISVFAGAAIVGLILLRHRIAPTAVRLYFVARGLLAAIVATSIALFTDFPSGASQSGPVWFNLGMLAFCGIGFLYWNRSRTVGFFEAAPVPAAGEHAPSRVSTSVPIPHVASLESAPAAVPVRILTPPTRPDIEQARLRTAPPSFDGPRMRLCYACGHRSAMDATLCTRCERPFPSMDSSQPASGLRSMNVGLLESDKDHDTL